MSAVRYIPMTAAGAVSTGQLHHALGIDCQDAFGLRQSNGVSVAALSDGGGSFHLAREAAMYQSDAFLGYFAEEFDPLFALSPEDLCQHLSQELPRRLAEYCQANGLDFNEMGATLLIAAIAQDGRYIVFHLGDGALFQLNHKDQLTLFSFPENEPGNATVTSFLNAPLLPGAGSFRAKTGWLDDQIRGFVLSTDGLSDFLDQTKEASALPVLQAARTGRLQQLVSNLAANVTTDDCSLVLLEGQLSTCLDMLSFGPNSYIHRADDPQPTHQKEELVCVTTSQS